MWRDTALNARVFMIDARAVLVFPLFIVYMRPITLYLLLFVIFLFTIIDVVIGHRLPVVLRMLRRRIAGLGSTSTVIAPPQTPRR